MWMPLLLMSVAQKDIEIRYHIDGVGASMSCIVFHGASMFAAPLLCPCLDMCAYVRA